MKDNNFYNTFIRVADDCPVSAAVVPQSKAGAKTIAVLQYEMIANHPYAYTQEDVLFEVFAERNAIPEEERETARKTFFSKGQPCLRTSPLGKRYGWGIHFDANGKAALYAVESAEYQTLMNDPTIKQVKAMRSGRRK